MKTLTEYDLNAIVSIMKGIANVEEAVKNGDVSFGHGPIALYGDGDFEDPIGYLVYGTDDAAWQFVQEDPS